MGVDASYLYGFVAENEAIEWDIDYLKEKYDIEENLTDYLAEYTYGDMINWLENNEVDDWDDLKDIIGLNSAFVYDTHYLYFNHKNLTNKYPEGKLKDLEKLSIKYLKDIGVKNPEIFSWREFGYFD